jgi:hypothetical protein
MARVETGALAEALRGKVGGVVFAQTPNGVVLMPRVVPRNPRTPAQTEVRANLARAVAAWGALTPAQAQAWAAYAATQVRADPKHGTARRPTAYLAFVGLATKFLQVTPNATPPAAPPLFPFAGDPLIVTAAGGPGVVTFTASAATSPDVLVELLWQPLRVSHNAPHPKGYRTQGFAAFAPGALSASVPAMAGWYAPAYRFVQSATGQETGLIALPAVQVP